MGGQCAAKSDEVKSLLAGHLAITVPVSAIDVTWLKKTIYGWLCGAMTLRWEGCKVLI